MQDAETFCLRGRVRNLVQESGGRRSQPAPRGFPLACALSLAVPDDYASGNEGRRGAPALSSAR